MTGECVVLGAGIVGVSVALRLAQKGVDVTLVDAGGPGGGTTGTSGSMVGANEKQPLDYFRLGLLSMAAMRRLGDELDHAEWLLPTGHLEWANTAGSQAALDARMSRLEGWDYPVHRLSPEQVTRDLEPELLIPPDVQQVTFFPDDSIVYPQILVGLMLRRAESLGVRCEFGAGTATIESAAGAVSGVTLGDGRRIGADVVVSCLGRWTESALGTVGVNIPLVSPWGSTPEALGLQVVTTGVPVDVRRMIRMPGLSIRPAGGGRLMLHGRPEEVELHAAGESSGLTWDRPLVPVPPQAHGLVDKARAVLKHMQSAAVYNAVAAVRPLPHDGLPILGWVPEANGLYVVVSHSGVGLGPLFGELVAAEVTGSDNSRLRPFRPDRFTGDAWRTRTTSPMRAVMDPWAPVN